MARGSLRRSSIDDAIRVQSYGRQLFGPPDLGQRWGTGFLLDSPPARPMLGDRSFGHDGAGGQLGFADDELGVGFAYLSNQMGGIADPRANRTNRRSQIMPPRLAVIEGYHTGKSARRRWTVA